jgi:prepilin-type N-terminal cleavage/methylation domain-containing protein
MFVPIAQDFRRPRNHGFTLVELLVVVGLIGVLVALLLPAVQAAREAARRTQCQNNLKQIGLGLIRYHDQHGTFPVGCVEWRPWGNTTYRQLAWSAYLLPYIEQQPLFERLDLSLAFDDPANAVAAATVLPVLLCPSVPAEHLSLTSGRGPTHYGGIFGERITSPNNPPKGVMLFDQAIPIREVLDGATYTLIVGEDSQFSDGEWVNGRNIFDQAYAINAAPEIENDIRSEHPGGANGVTCGGSVHFLTEEIDLNVLAALCTRAGNEPIGVLE